mmetsp:Transcript_19/g.62  ORF Transcript_19/g.62 Transcript_19/m.62 type:complete len:397 (-) Transcript_19:105-1295(-)
MRLSPDSGGQLNFLVASVLLQAPWGALGSWSSQDDALQYQAIRSGPGDMLEPKAEVGVIDAPNYGVYVDEAPDDEALPLAPSRLMAKILRAFVVGTPLELAAAWRWRKRRQRLRAAAEGEPAEARAGGKLPLIVQDSGSQYQVLWLWYIVAAALALLVLCVIARRRQRRLQWSAALSERSSEAVPATSAAAYTRKSSVSRSTLGPRTPGNDVKGTPASSAVIRRNAASESKDMEDAQMYSIASCPPSGYATPLRGVSEQGEKEAGKVIKTPRFTLAATPTPWELQPDRLEVGSTVILVGLTGSGEILEAGSGNRSYKVRLADSHAERWFPADEVVLVPPGVDLADCVITDEEGASRAFERLRSGGTSEHCIYSENNSVADATEQRDDIKSEEIPVR